MRSIDAERTESEAEEAIEAAWSVHRLRQRETGQGARIGREVFGNSPFVVARCRKAEAVFVIQPMMVREAGERKKEASDAPGDD